MFASVMHLIKKVRELERRVRDLELITGLAKDVVVTITPVKVEKIKDE